MPEFLEPYTGHLAGVATALLWTGTSIFFTAAGRRIGPTAVNFSRMLFAIVLLGITHRLLSGGWLPDAVPRQIVFLAVSGLVGLTIGDQALFTAFVDIGPRLAILLMTTAPLFAAFFGWVVLGERLSGLAALGVAMTICGVAWAVFERPGESKLPRSPHRVRGVLLALVGGACQGGGLLLSKQGMGHGWLPQDQLLSPQAATLVRVCFGAVCMLPVIVLRWYHFRTHGQLVLSERRAGSPRAGYLFAMAGAVVGPFLGIWMSLVAADRAPLGIAQTLCSLAPIFLLPVVAVVYKERISPRAAGGAVLAVAGSALLFVEAN